MPKAANTSRNGRAEALQKERYVTAAAAKALRLKKGHMDKGEPTALTSAAEMPAELLKCK